MCIFVHCFLITRNSWATNVALVLFFLSFFSFFFFGLLTLRPVSKTRCFETTCISISSLSLCADSKMTLLSKMAFGFGCRMNDEYLRQGRSDDLVVNTETPKNRYSLSTSSLTVQELLPPTTHPSTSAPNL